MSGPLDGVKVLDFTQNLPGPYASFILQSMGAEVIKVEPPRGDPARHMGEFFELLNAGKKSVVLDLRDEANKPALEKLVRWADVLLDGFRPGVMARLGADYETAKGWNRGLIYCSISAFGQQGPRRDEPGHDLNLQALAGICHLERETDRSPRGSVIPVADLSTSLVAVSSICAALHARRGRHPTGRYLDVAMSDAVLSWAHVWGEGVDLAAQAREQLPKGPAQRLAGPLLRRLDRLKLFAMPQYGLYRCGDGKVLAMGIVDEKHFWKAMCEQLGLGRLSAIPMPMRTALGPVLRPLIARKLRKRSRDEWLRRLVDAGVPATPVNTVAEAKADAQYRARGLVDDRGRVRAPLPDTAFISGRAPQLGEHTEAVLASLDS